MNFKSIQSFKVLTKFTYCLHLITFYRDVNYIHSLNKFILLANINYFWIMAKQKQSILKLGSKNHVENRQKMCLLCLQKVSRNHKWKTKSKIRIVSLDNEETIKKHFIQEYDFNDARWPAVMCPCCSRIFTGRKNENFSRKYQPPDYTSITKPTNQVANKRNTRAGKNCVCKCFICVQVLNPKLKGHQRDTYGEASTEEASTMEFGSEMMSGESEIEFFSESETVMVTESETTSVYENDLSIAPNSNIINEGFSLRCNKCLSEVMEASFGSHLCNLDVFLDQVQKFILKNNAGDMIALSVIKDKMSETNQSHEVSLKNRHGKKTLVYTKKPKELIKWNLSDVIEIHTNVAKSVRKTKWILQKLREKKLSFFYK